ncbi:MAG: antibiotic biosynthesis monooxygenase [Clostridiales Family XIII bacterium]|nr:antibiotic biosynthesis monooxygenase [Clostridiales Family XIII bacterium]
MVIAYFKMKLNKGAREDFIEDLRAIDAFSKARTEDGNISYEYSFSVEDADTIIGVERWASLPDFQAHLAQPYVQGIGDIQKKYDAVMEPYLYEGESCE